MTRFTPAHAVGQGITLAGGLRIVCTLYTHSHHCTHTPYVGVAQYKHSFTMCV